MKHQHAFSLIEMLIVLSISAILLAISLPMLQHMRVKSTDEILQSQLLRTLELAREAAHTNRLPVTLCKSKNHTTCGGSWNDDWLVFTDENEDGIVQDKTQIVTVMQTGSPRGVLHWRSFPLYRDSLLFLPNGFTRSDNGTFWYCHAKEEQPVWAIVLSKSGRARVAHPNQNGVINDSHGKALRCG